MTAETVASAGWLRFRWGAAILFVVAIQVGLVFWLSDRSLITAPPPAGEPAVYMVEGALDRMPTLSDSQMFSPANPHGFSGVVWSKTPKLEYQIPDWTAPPSGLTMSFQNLGNTFSRITPARVNPIAEVADLPDPVESSPELFPSAPTVPTMSELRVEGELAQRALVSTVHLTNWPAVSILLPTVVQVMVDGEGNTVSASLLTKSGNEAADKQALTLAKTARYHSIRDGASGILSINHLTWGRLVFDWHTVAPAAIPATSTKP